MIPKHRRSVLFAPILLTLSLSLSACGSDGSIPASPYTGPRTQAAIGSDNAVDISTLSFEGGATGNSFNILAFDQGGATHPSGGVSAVLLPKILNEPIHQIDFMPNGRTSPRATQTVSDSIPGGCGGAITYTFNVDDQSGGFNGTMSFNDYCEDDVLISGSLTISGQMNADTNALESFSFSFVSLSVTVAGETFSYTGDMTFDLTNINSPMTMNLFLTDPVTGKVFWLEGYQVTLTDGPGYTDMSISGRFYHPDHGFVDVSTETALRVNVGDTYPSSGVFIAVGSGGTKARLTALSATTFQVEADTDGDGIMDCSTGVMNWTSFTGTPCL